MFVPLAAIEAAEAGSAAKCLSDTWAEVRATHGVETSALPRDGIMEELNGGLSVWVDFSKVPPVGEVCTLAEFSRATRVEVSASAAIAGASSAPLSLAPAALSLPVAGPSHPLVAAAPRAASSLPDIIMPCSCLGSSCGGNCAAVLAYRETRLLREPAGSAAGLHEPFQMPPSSLQEAAVSREDLNCAVPKTSTAFSPMHTSSDTNANILSDKPASQLESISRDVHPAESRGRHNASMVVQYLGLPRKEGSPLLSMQVTPIGRAGLRRSASLAAGSAAPAQEGGNTAALGTASWKMHPVRLRVF